MARDVLELVGQRAAVGLTQLGKGLGQGLRRDVKAEDARWDPGLELGREPGHEPVRVERGVAGRLRAQWVDVSGQVAVGPMRLDQRHRRRNAPEEQVVGSGLGRRGSRGGSHGRGAVAATVARELAQPLRVGQAGEDELRVGLEEGPPFRVDGLRGGEVLGQQLLDEAAVEVVYLVGFHSAPSQ